MSGPATVPCGGGFDSSKTACAAAKAGIKNETTAENNIDVKRLRRPGSMNFLFTQNSEKLARDSPDYWEKIILELKWIANSFGRVIP
jgi:hypothetical protein